jgi:hypothetical protein
MAELPFNLIEHVLVCTSQNYGACIRFLAPFEKNKIIITNCLFNNFLTLPKERWINVFFTFWSCHGGNDSGPSELSNGLKITKWNSSKTDASSLNKIFGSKIINSHSG